nr:apolipoprotein N-acyltransferase [Herbaspirillum sp. RV1423]
MPTSTASRWTPLFAVLAGVANVLAFAPFNIWPIQILTLAWLFRQVARGDSLKRNALTGWLYGFGWAACGVHWLYISMHDYGGMAAWMAALAVGLLAAYLGIYAALSTGIASWLRRRRPMSPTVLLLLVLPALWALTEWARGWIFTGFPWLTSGYAHSVGPFAGYAPLVGVYGIAWIAAAVAGALAMLSLRTGPRALPAVLAVALAGAGVALHAIDWTHAAGRPITVRLLQGNIPQEMKFSNDALLSSLMMYDEMIRSAPTDLIATPETAVPLLPQQLPPDYLARLIRFVQTSGSHLALGIPLSDGPGLYANSVIGFSPDPATARTPYRYDKHHLVPFGEFIPFGFHWFVDMMSIPLGDMTRGKPLQMPFEVRQQWIMPNICYEDLFGEEIAAQLGGAYYAGQPQASILLNLSNIAWFGNSIALPQHLQISQMRTLETGRPMLRSTNTGATAVIGPKGQLESELQPYTRNMLSASVQGYQGQTPYILLGNKLMLALTAAALAAAWLLSRRKGAKE